ncbi:MAG: RagB/SusD family nutrient uptake outer membrane protein [Prevotella sp.]|nr:RagB/SusD family nutrient uptake outer membrane protein [Prevotella sp.]
MKRNIQLFAAAAFIGLTVVSCDLDEVNPAAGDATLTAYEAWSGLQNTCYTALNDQLYTASDWLFLSEAGTDEWLAKSNGTGYKQIFNYEDLTSSYNTTQKVFKQCYALISSCNTVINEAKNLRDGDAESIRKLVAETKALRALYYSILVAHYGPVTLNLESSSSVTGDVNLYPKRNTEKEIYDQIIKDLKEAITDLPVTNENYARLTKKSAIGLLARVYAQRAGLGQSKYGDAQEYWKLCAETAEGLISNASAYNAYLYPDIADMWADANNRKNKEALIIAAGPDGNNAAWQFMSKNNKLFAYSSGATYSDFWNKNHKPGDKGYFYGRQNAQTWMPSKYLMYCFDPTWDRRWEYSFQYAWGEWTMVQCGWVPYNKGQFKLTDALCRKYDIDSTSLRHVGKIIYPYADCDGKASTYAGNQYPAKIWPKGDHSGDASKLLTVAPSAAMCGQKGYAETTKAYAVPYPVAADDDRINSVFVHYPLADKADRPYAVIVLSDLYDSNDMPFGGIDQGSEAGNPIHVGNGKTSSNVCPGLIKFNWSYDGVFVGSNLQIKTGDMFVMRMAEVYLLAAEAEQQLGNASKAADYLNVLRKRAVRQGVAESAWKITNVTEDTIFDEYARELCGEFSRWALLKRHNAFESRLAKYNKRAAASFKKLNYNRPIAYDFLSTILNADEYGDNGYGSTATSGLSGFE